MGRMGSQVSGCGGVWTWGIGDPQKLKTCFLELVTSFLEPQVGGRAFFRPLLPG